MGCAMLDFNFEPGVIVPQQYGTGYEMIEILRIEGLSSSYLLKGGGHRGEGSRGSPIFGKQCF